MANTEIANGLKTHHHLLKSLKYLGDDIIVWSIERDYINILKSLYSDSFKAIRDIHYRPLLQIAMECKAKQTEFFLVEKKAYKNPLHIAVECDKMNLIQRFITKINSKDGKGRTPIFLAKTFEVFEFLIEAKANLQTKDDDENTVLHYAALNGDVEFVENIIHLQDSNGFCLLKYICFNNKCGNTPFHVAAIYGKLDVLVYLFEKNLECNKNSKDRQTPVLKSNPTLLETHTFYESGSLMNIAIDAYYERNNLNPNAINYIKGACQLIGIDVNSRIGSGNTVLHTAAAKNCKELAEFFLEHGADPDIRNKSGQTPLNLAVKNGSHDTVEFLVTKAINLCLKDEDGNNVLHLAAQLEDSKCLELLIRKYQSLNLSIDEENKLRMTALNNAIESSKGTNVELLIFAGALPNLNFIRGSSYYTFYKYDCYLARVFHVSQKDFCVGSEDSKQILDKFGCNIDWSKQLGDDALHFAARWGLAFVVKLLITFNFDVNGLNEKGETPLMLARNKDIFLLLLSAGANWFSTNHVNSDIDFRSLAATTSMSREILEYVLEKNPTLINRTNRFGETALHIAVKNNTNILEFLIHLNADPNIENNEGKTPIIYAIESKSTRYVELLLKHSAKIDLLDDNGILKEELNFFYSSVKLVEQLLKEKNFNVNAADANGLTPLHHAAKCGELILLQLPSREETCVLSKVLHLLLKAGADVDAVDSDGNSPLHYATQPLAVSILIAYNSDINRKNNNGETPLHFSHSFNGGSIEILLAKGACPDLANNDGNTPLHLAVITCYQNILFLIDHSSEADRQNNNGDTALHLAVIKNEFKIVEALIAKKANLSLKNRDNKTALELAAENIERQEIFLLLTSQLQSPNSSDQAIKYRKRKQSSDF